MKKLQFSLAALLFAGLFTLAFLGCKKEKGDPSLTSNGTVVTLTAPSITCESATGSSITLKVCGTGTYGSPAGFSVQWMTKAQYDIAGWPISSDLPDPVTQSSFCKASFSCVPGCSNYNLAAGACVTVKIGGKFDACGASGGCGDLKCNTHYVFRAFSHNDPKTGYCKSGFCANTTCCTSPCGTTGCTYTQGFWKTHGPIPTGMNTNVWPVTSLTLGTVVYTDLQALSIFTTPPTGNGLISLAHQLMAAKLNIANGSDPSAIQASIDAADALIGGLVVPPVGSGFLSPATTSALNTALTNYNEGATGPGHCQ